MWHDYGSEPAEYKFFVLLYFMADDRVEIYESKEIINNMGNQNPFPLFLGKIKLPKDWSNSPRKYSFLLAKLNVKYNLLPI